MMPTTSQSISVSFIVQATGERIFTAELPAVPRVGEAISLSLKHRRSVGTVVNVVWEIDFTEDEPIGTQFTAVNASVYFE